MCLSKPMERAILRVNLNVNCGLWATRLCPRRLLDGDSRTAAVWVPGVGQVCGNPALSTQFAMNLTLLPR